MLGTRTKVRCPIHGDLGFKQPGTRLLGRASPELAQGTFSFSVAGDMPMEFCYACVRALIARMTPPLIYEEIEDASDK